MKSYMQARDHVMCGDHLFDDLLEFPNGDDDDSDLLFLMKTPAAANYDDDDDIAPLQLPDHPTTTTTTTTGAPQLYYSSPPRLYGEEMVVGLFGVGHPADDSNRDHDKTFGELDMAELEWVSNFMDESSSPDSFSVLVDVEQQQERINNKEEEGQFRSHSPVSVLLQQQQLPNNNSYEAEMNNFRSSSSSIISAAAVPVRPRSKRPRTARRHFSPPHPHPHPPPDQIIINNKGNKNNKKMMNKEEEDMAAPVMRRKCRHCQIEKTPQWRAGPMGPKTLCNACGVRYMKTGRLFQEYRPAASPTFVPSLHSNSHKKVIQMMRINATTHLLLHPDHIIDY